MKPGRFELAWKQAEASGPRPSRVRHVIHRDYKLFANQVMDESPSFVGWAVDRLYQGDVFILRNAFPAEFMESTRDKVFEWFKTRPSEFHKMLEGTPDFHRVIDLEAGKKYSFNVCKHSAFFYPWNDDPLNLFPIIYERWRVIKQLMGLEATAYEKNTPKDGVVDRIQVAQYPSRCGYLEPHSDPYLHQRLFFSGYMSRRGADYSGGGFYLVGKADTVIEAENQIEVGDVGIGYATVYHGVAPCNRHLEPDWESKAGRWFLSMYSNASDEVKDRHTGHPVKLDLPEVLP